MFARADPFPAEQLENFKMLLLENDTGMSYYRTVSCGKANVFNCNQLITLSQSEHLALFKERF